MALVASSLRRSKWSDIETAADDLPASSVVLSTVALDPNPVISRVEIPRCSEPLTDPRQSAMLLPWLGAADAIRSAEKTKVHHVVRRRGGVAVALVARAQQPAMPVIGFVWYGSAAEWAPFVTTFRQGLEEIGFIEGQNLAIEFHWTQGQNDQQAAVAADLVRRQMAVIVTGTIGGLAAKAATTTIPIVFVVGADPVKTGLVTSLNRPGTNVTGVSFFSNELMAKRLGLLHELLPQASVIAVLLNPSFPDADEQLKVLQGAAGTLGLHIFVVNASNDSEIGRGFATIAQQRVHALIVAADPFFTSRRDHIIALANRHSVPAIYDLRNWPTAGGLISYGTDVADAFRQTGIYTGKILKGTQPADLPVMQSTKYELVINLNTAKALGLEIPPMLLARADEVIE